MIILLISLISVLTTAFIHEQVNLMSNFTNTMGILIDGIESNYNDRYTLTNEIALAEYLENKDDEFVNNILSRLASRTDIVTATIYNAHPSQTDNSPNITADNTEFNIDSTHVYSYIAVSRDLLRKYNYGDIVLISGAGELDGKWEVRDTMNPRYVKSIDFLVPKTTKPDKWKNVTMQRLSK